MMVLTEVWKLSQVSGKMGTSECSHVPHGLWDVVCILLEVLRILREVVRILLEVIRILQEVVRILQEVVLKCMFSSRKQKEKILWNNESYPITTTSQ